MKGLCIIPARGGSKRVPRKNIKPFNNSTLLDITISSAIESKQFEKIIVTSEDNEILERASAHKEVSIHKREPALSSDTATVFQVFYDILMHEKEFDFIAGVLVTTPFKTKKHIAEAVDLFKDQQGKKNVISVVKFDYPPQFGFQIEQNDLKMMFPEVFAKTTNSKFMEPWYHNNGAIWIASRDAYVKNKTFYGGEMVPYIMDEWSSFDIDYPWQFELAEHIAQSNLLNNE